MSALMQRLGSELGQQRWSDRALTASAMAPGRAIVSGRECLVLCSNDYLGLAGDERVVAAAAEAGARYGFGSRAARSLLGDTTVHRELEAALADLKGAEAAMLFSSGYMCNIAVMATVARDGDLILSDELNHASIVDGARLSRAEVAVHRHRDVEDLAAHLDRRSNDGSALIVTESVFSMVGDVTPLAAIVDLASKHDAVVILDEAHATGVLGPGGEGLLADAGLHDQVDIITGTLGKALGSVGGFVAGDHRLIEFLADHARTFLFDTALPAPAVAAALASLRIMTSEPDRVAALRRNVESTRAGLRNIGYQMLESGSAIIPVEFSDSHAARETCDRLGEHGVIALPIGPPYVPAGTSRIRVQGCASHTERDLDRILSAFAASAPAER